MNSLNAPPNTPSLAAARAARLRYVSDEQPGFTRKRRGRHFAYYDTKGALLHDQQHLSRIRSLAIPPAWTQVWISPYANSHIQATGRDQRGRKQYRYHPRWCELRNETKFERLLAFGDALPRLRTRVEQDLRSPGLSRKKVLAAVVRLLETTLIRVGNEEYARSNDSYGLTTLRNDHVEVKGTSLHFHFKGKSGIEHDINLRDPRLSRIVKACQELPGQELFEYVDDQGQIHSIDSADVNAYLHEATSEEFTAKDFRTWAGTLCAVLALKGLGIADGVTQTRKNLVQAIKLVAQRLGNTPAVCRKYYVHPAVLEAYTAGTLLSAFQAASRAAEAKELAEVLIPPADLAKVPSHSLFPEERDVMDFLRTSLGA